MKFNNQQLVTVVEDNGKEIKLVHLDTIMYNNAVYAALADAPEGANEIQIDQFRPFLVKKDEKTGEENLLPIEDKDLFTRIAEIFYYRLELLANITDDGENKEFYFCLSIADLTLPCLVRLQIFLTHIC